MTQSKFSKRFQALKGYQNGSEMKSTFMRVGAKPGEQSRSDSMQRTGVLREGVLDGESFRGFIFPFSSESM
jgi:hypothetical protein